MQTLFDRFDRRGDAEQSPDQHATMTREQVVDRIITINPTATRDYLDRFNRRELGNYLERLTLAGGPRGRGVRGWIRPGVCPGIVVSESEV